MKGLPPITKRDDQDVTFMIKYQDMRQGLEDLHDRAHMYIGGINDGGDPKGTIANPHIAFRDPFVFLLHSNVDRIFATWQLQPWLWSRLNPETVYDFESGTVATGSVAGDDLSVGILTPLEPWAGIDAPGVEDGMRPARPWAPPENQMIIKNSKHISIVIPRHYDTTYYLGMKIGGFISRLGRREFERIKPVWQEHGFTNLAEPVPTQLDVITERLARIEEHLAYMGRLNRHPTVENDHKRGKSQPDND